MLTLTSFPYRIFYANRVAYETISSTRLSGNSRCNLNSESDLIGKSFYDIFNVVQQNQYNEQKVPSFDDEDSASSSYGPSLASYTSPLGDNGTSEDGYQIGTVQIKSETTNGSIGSLNCPPLQPRPSLESPADTTCSGYYCNIKVQPICDNNKNDDRQSSNAIKYYAVEMLA